MATQTLQRYFVGFSTRNSAQTGVRTFYDINLVNIDLMTAFQTRIGERVMRPDWGCALWDYVMEQLTATMRDKIVTECERICGLNTHVCKVRLCLFKYLNPIKDFV